MNTTTQPVSHSKGKAVAIIGAVLAILLISYFSLTSAKTRIRPGRGLRITKVDLLGWSKTVYSKGLRMIESKEGRGIVVLGEELVIYNNPFIQADGNIDFAVSYNKGRGGVEWLDMRSGKTVYHVMKKRQGEGYAVRDSSLRRGLKEGERTDALIKQCLFTAEQNLINARVRFTNQVRKAESKFVNAQVRERERRRRGRGPGPIHHVIKRVDAVYPEEAVKANIESRVEVSLHVNSQGKGTSASTPTVNSNQLLVDAAINAAMQWEFEPFIVNGKPEEFTTTLIFSFILNPDNLSYGPVSGHVGGVRHRERDKDQPPMKENQEAPPKEKKLDYKRR